MEEALQPLKRLAAAAREQFNLAKAEHDMKVAAGQGAQQERGQGGRQDPGEEQVGRRGYLFKSREHRGADAQALRHHQCHGRGARRASAAEPQWPARAPGRDALAPRSPGRGRPRGRARFLPYGLERATRPTRSTASGAGSTCTSTPSACRCSEAHSRGASPSTSSKCAEGVAAMTA